MCLTDTAEYWWDIKGHNRNFKEFYCLPDVECGFTHHNIAEFIEQVNCRGCKKLINEGITHNLPTKKEFKVKQQEEREYRRCNCGRNMVIRTNRSNGEKFLGCTGYPKCNNTKPLSTNK